MPTTMKRKKIFHSIEEVEREYYPKSYQTKLSEQPKDATEIGSSLAKESLDKIKKKLV